jgi:hypothetical protein
MGQTMGVRRLLPAQATNSDGLRHRALQSGKRWAFVGCCPRRPPTAMACATAASGGFWKAPDKATQAED